MSSLSNLFGLSVRALVEVKYLNINIIVVYCICKYSTTYMFNVSLSVSIVCMQLLVGCNNIYWMESHFVNFTNVEDHYGL